MNTLEDLRTLERPDKPNTALSAPAGVSLTAKADRQTPEFTMPVSALADLACQVWSGQDRVSLETRSDDGLKAHFIARTAILRLKDDIQVEFVSINEAASSFIIYSASRVGYSDLGTNAKRVDEWINKLIEAQKGA